MEEAWSGQKLSNNPVYIDKNIAYINIFAQYAIKFHIIYDT